MNVQCLRKSSKVRASLRSAGVAGQPAVGVDRSGSVVFNHWLYGKVTLNIPYHFCFAVIWKTRCNNVTNSNLNLSCQGCCDKMRDDSSTPFCAQWYKHRVTWTITFQRGCRSFCKWLTDCMNWHNQDDSWPFHRLDYVMTKLHWQRKTPETLRSKLW